MIPPAKASAAQGPEAKREHQEQVADLRHRRIGDQQLQPRLAQSEHAAEEDRGRPERGENRARRQLGSAASTSNQSRTTRKNDPLTTSPESTRAGRGGRVGVGGRQPQMQREQRGLRQESRGHQARPPATRRARREYATQGARCRACHRPRRSARRRADRAPSRTARTGDSAAPRPPSPDVRREKPAEPRRR